jgi:hypothetical protein
MDLYNDFVKSELDIDSYFNGLGSELSKYKTQEAKDVFSAFGSYFGSGTQLTDSNFGDLTEEGKPTTGTLRAGLAWYNA